MRRQHTLTLMLLAFGQGPLLAEEMPRHSPAPPLSASGASGLVRIPTADVRRYGQYTLGVNFVDARHRVYHTQNTVAHFVTLGVLPQVEVTGRITNFEGRLGVQFRPYHPKMPAGGWNMDRSIGVHVQLLPQKGRWPVAVAVGDEDVTGNGVFQARYLVASRRWPRAGVHLGVGSGTLGRVFGGVDFRAHDRVRVLLDHDGNRPNLGCAVEFDHFVVQPFLTGLKAFGAGITYNQPL